MILYVTIQIIAVCFDYLTFLYLINWELSTPLAANALGKIVGASLAFVGHKYFTFRISANQNNASNISSQGLKYLLTLPANIIVSSAIITALILLQIAPTISKITSDVLTLILFFFVNKYLVFR